MRLVTLGEHKGNARRLARGVRMTCRPYLDRWGFDHLDPDVAVKQCEYDFSTVDKPGDILTWVPGHDKSNGPGHAVAEVLAGLWGVPLVETLKRSCPVRSAHSAPSARPSIDEVRSSLSALDPTALDVVDRTVVVVDNVIASGASVIGSAQLLLDAGFRVDGIVSISVDLSAGSRHYITPRSDTSWVFTLPRSARADGHDPILGP